MTIIELDNLCKTYRITNPEGLVYVRTFDEEGYPVEYAITGFEEYLDENANKNFVLIGYPL